MNPTEIDVDVAAAARIMIAALAGGLPWVAAVFGMAAAFCLGEHVGRRR